MKPAFVFDVESIGLHGEGFAVAGCIITGPPTSLDPGREGEFVFACPPYMAFGNEPDRAWVAANVPPIAVTHTNPKEVRDAFWAEWEKAKAKYPGIEMWAECLWPVEAHFVEACVADAPTNRIFAGPYPFHEIATMMTAARMDPMATYERLLDELPKHDPLGDTRQSARLLVEAQGKLGLV